jgi:4-hydroxybenzoate polyprenyltransferase
MGVTGNMIDRVVLFLRMIKFSHSVFALPFAFSAGLLAAGGIPTVSKIVWITIAMVSARSAAMGMNRIIDKEIDAKNPRTSMRELPAGKIGVRAAILFTVIAVALLAIAAANLNPLCLKLTPVAVAVLFIYSYTKRFTWLSHAVLGVAISGAPLGAWMAITGGVSLNVVPLVVAVIFWLAGFDILYALQDIDFDRAHGLHSVPQRFGTGRSLIIARASHAVTWGLLAATGFIFGLGFIYYAGMAAVGGLLIYEHSLVRENDLSKLDMAFFNMNGYISLTVFLVILGDLMVRG